MFFLSWFLTSARSSKGLVLAGGSSMAANLTYNADLEELRVVLLPQYASAILGSLAVANTLYVLLAGCCLFCSLSLWSTSWPRFSRYNKITFSLIGG